MISKVVATAAEAIADLHDGAAIMISGFGEAGVPAALIDAVVAHGATDLTIISIIGTTQELTPWAFAYQLITP